MRREVVTLAACFGLALAGCGTATDGSTGALEEDRVQVGSQQDGGEASASHQGVSGSHGPDARARAEQAANHYSDRLRSRLQASMQTEGLAAAVDVCHAEAVEIAAEVGAEMGVRIGRVAVHGRQRNPLNIPQGWQSGALSDFQAAVDRGARAEDQVFRQHEELPDGVAYRTMFGIRSQAICGTCHGVDPQPEALEAIARLYPGDRATGFSEGDLHGGLWIEVIRDATLP